MPGVPADLMEVAAEIIRTEGPNTLTFKDLRARLEAKYQMDLTPHEKAVEEAAKAAMQLPDIARQLLKAKAAMESGPIGGKGKKRQASKKEAAPAPKQKKPEGYPKGALLPYIIFGNEVREKIKQENPNFTSAEIMKATGEMWNKLPENEKEKYKVLSDKDKKRFEKEMEEYKAKGGTVVGRAGSKKTAKEGPKRPKNAFMFFSSEFRANHPGNITDVSRAAGAEWKNMSDAAKKKFEDMAEADKKRYNDELNA